MLANEGMSTQAIAPIVGASKDTVHRDLIAGVSNETPAPEPEPAPLTDEPGQVIKLTGVSGAGCWLVCAPAVIARWFKWRGLVSSKFGFGLCVELG